MKKRFFALLLALIMALSLLPVTVSAATEISSSPYAKVEYGYTASTPAGTIRYISQLTSSGYFNWNYWPAAHSLTNYSSPGSECGTACISMALSYIGINKTPYDILVPYDGTTMFGIGWGGSTYSAPSVSTGMDRFKSGNGKYSPVVICLSGAGSYNSYTGAYNDHYIMLAGHLSGTTYHYVDPASDYIGTTTISGSSATYKSSSYTIKQVHQWYNPGASIPPTSYTPTGVVDSIVGDVNCIHVTGWAFDSDCPSAQLPIHVYIGGECQEVIWANTYRTDVDSVFGVGAYHGFDAWITTSKSGTQEIALYAINVDKNGDDAGSGHTLIGSNTVTIGAKAPVISNVKILNVSENGFDISCTVTDDNEISRVLFPTWTVYNDQDDLPQPWTTNPLCVGSFDGSTAAYHVDTAEHNGELGLYSCHIYAFDEYGNTTCYECYIFIGTSPDDIGATVLASSEYNGHTYILINYINNNENQLSWQLASTFCQSLGGTLACITSEEENAVVKNLISGRCSSVWIGGNDLGKEGTFVWESGEEFSYAPWAPGEPNNQGDLETNNGEEDYIEFRDTGEWNDLGDGNSCAFVLEIETHCVHEYSYEVTKEPTDIATGMLTGTCALCSKATEIALPKLNTTDYSYSVVNAATCTATGTGRYTWKTTTYGSYYFDVALAKTAHNYTAAVTAPTCTAQGYTTHTCTACGDSYKDTYTAALGHNYSYKVTTTPTTSATGALTGSCSRCSGTTTVTLPKLNTTDYSYSVVKEATCTATGTGRYTWKTMTYGSFYFDVTIAKTAHNYTTTVTAPTCTAQGYTTHTCTACGDSYKDTYIAALGHSESTWIVDHNATCTASGSKHTECMRCGVVMQTATIAANGHTAGTWIIDKNATCTESGTKHTECTACGATLETATIPAAGHSYTTSVTEPTCTAQGYTTHTCTVCGDSYKDTYATELGHAWDNGAVTTQPTEIKEGVKTFTCTRCGATKTESIPATGEQNNDPCDGGENCPSGKFVDVNPKEWYHPYVDYAVTHGLFGGTSENTFEPETAMTRAMLVTVLWRYEGEPEAGENTFSDVPNGQWYTNAVAWAAANGVVNGVGNGKFDPEGKITREQMATILFRYAKKKGIDTSKRGSLNIFSDEKQLSDYAKDAVQWAVAEQIINGSDGKLLPQGSATRAQVATILMRFIENKIK